MGRIRNSRIRGGDNMSTKRILHFIILLSLGLALAGCERTKIGDIVADPGRYRDKEVSVAGQVTQSIGLLDKGIYQIDDGTGKLWVLANRRGVPSKGARVGAKGQITPTLTFMGINY